MTRETKAERMTREQEEEIELQQQKIIAGYPLRLVRALERVSKYGWYVEFEEHYDGEHIINITCDGLAGYSELQVQALPTHDDMWLTDLEDQLNMEDLKQKEQTDEENLKAQALSKLTEKEKRALGF